MCYEIYAGLGSCNSGLLSGASPMTQKVPFYAGNNAHGAKPVAGYNKSYKFKYI